MNTAVNNVIPMNPESEEFVFARAFHIIRTLDTVKTRMEAAKKNAGAIWSGKLNDTTKEYRDIARTDFGTVEKMSAKTAKDNYVQVVNLIGKRDSIVDEKKTDLTDRKTKINKVEAAYAEVVALSKASSGGDQLGLYAQTTGAIPGLGWASKATNDAIYSALLSLAEDKALDVHQERLLADMANAGLESIDLGLEAAQAIEVDDAGDPEAADEGEGEDEDQFEFPD
jgi:hypothetical protein